MSNAESIFHEARPLAGDARDAYLKGACGDDLALRNKVEALLKADDEAGDFLRTADPDDTDATSPGVAPAGGSAAHAESAGQRIDRYKLLQQIGEGGFGSVWMAEQREPVRRKVALKIIKLGMDTKQVIARFEAERQALAMMDHPNIAKVLDAGATEAGRPYFVMELVKGVPILEFCDTEKFNTQQRLNLFIQVCNAIQHAHQKGIIHRDIKPSNVLVTLHDGMPVVKVIDFGIAKATNAELTQKTLFTEHRQLIGTPAYMSPEQAEMSGLDIDTRSDVYSLGVLLYELLTGTTPFDQNELMSKGFAEMMRIIREVEPHKPSTRLSSLGETGTRTAALRRADVRKLGSMLCGDLDWIVMKCLEKDRGRRYETASGLAVDVRRHLAGDPIDAAPPSRMYRMKKFVRRNRAAVWAGTAMVTLLLLAVVGTSLGMRLAQRAKESEAIQRQVAEANEHRAIEEAKRAENEAKRALAAEREAEQRAEELELVADFQRSQLARVQTEQMGLGIRRNIIEKRRVFLKGQDFVEESIEAALAELQQSLVGVNFTDVALQTLDENIFERALIAIEEQFADQPEVKARLLQTLAQTLRELGLLSRALPPQVQALDIRRQIHGRDHSDSIASLSSMGVLLRALGRFGESEKYVQQALEASRLVHGPDHALTLMYHSNLALLINELGRLEEAETHYYEVLENCRRAFGDDHATTLSTMSNIGSLLHEQGRLEESEKYFREVLDRRRRLLNEDDPELLTSVNNMGVVLGQQGRREEARPYYREALERCRRLLGDDHPDTLVSIANKSALLYDMKEFKEAERLAAEAVARAQVILPEDHVHFGFFLVVHAQSLAALDHFAEAEQHLLNAYAIFDSAFPDSHDSINRTINYIIHLYRRWHHAEPGHGYDDKMAAWQAKMDDHSP